MRTIHKTGRFDVHLIGMMDENRIRNLKTYTYHRPRKPLSATSTRDRANVTAHKIWKARKLTSNSQARLLSYLREPVDFEIQQSDLSLWVTSVHHCSSFGSSVDYESNRRTGREDGVRPQHVFGCQGLHCWHGDHGDIVRRLGR